MGTNKYVMYIIHRALLGTQSFGLSVAGWIDSGQNLKAEIDSGNMNYLEIIKDLTAPHRISKYRKVLGSTLQFISLLYSTSASTVLYCNVPQLTVPYSTLPYLTYFALLHFTLPPYLSLAYLTEESKISNSCSLEVE